METRRQSTSSARPHGLQPTHCLTHSPASRRVSDSLKFSHEPGLLATLLFSLSTHILKGHARTHVRHAMTDHGDERHVITIGNSSDSEEADITSSIKGKGKAATNTDTNTIVIKDESDGADADDADDSSHDLCLICLRSDIQDRSVLPTCLHSLFCFECILQWSEIKRTCPLCKRPIGDYILHNVRNDSDYSRHFLRPESGAQGHDAAIAAAAEGSIDAERQRAQVRRRLRGRYAIEQAQVSGGLGTSRYLPIRPRQGERSGWTEWARSGSSAASEEATEAAFAELDRAIERRRLVYRRGLYAKVSERHQDVEYTASYSSPTLSTAHRIQSTLRFPRPTNTTRL